MDSIGFSVPDAPKDVLCPIPAESEVEPLGFPENRVPAELRSADQSLLRL